MYPATFENEEETGLTLNDDDDDLILRQKVDTTS